MVLTLRFTTWDFLSVPHSTVDLQCLKKLSSKNYKYKKLTQDYSFIKFNPWIPYNQTARIIFTSNFLFLKIFSIVALWKIQGSIVGPMMREMIWKFLGRHNNWQWKSDRTISTWTWPVSGKGWPTASERHWSTVAGTGVRCLGVPPNANWRAIRTARFWCATRRQTNPCSRSVSAVLDAPCTVASNTVAVTGECQPLSHHYWSLQTKWLL